MKSCVQKKVQVSAIGMTFVLIALGCAEISFMTKDKKKQQQVEVDSGSKLQETQPQVIPPPPVVYFTHTVKYPGETVSIIAAWYTKDKMNYPKLAEANPGIDPERITIGNEIRIPEGLIQNWDPMPKEFVDRFYLKEESTKESKPLQDDLDLIPPKP